MRIYRAIIIDDERHCIGSLKTKLEWTGLPIEVIGTAESVSQGRELIRSLKPDFLFLDIKMPQSSGFELIKEVDLSVTEVIMCTAFEEYAFESYRNFAAGYLLKPVQADELGKLLRVLIARKQPSEVSRKAMIIEGPDKTRIDVSKALYIISEGNYSAAIFQDGNKAPLKGSLRELEVHLTGENYLRIHHKYLVNRAFVQTSKLSAEPYVLLSDGSRLPVSRSRKRELYNLLA